MKTKTIVVFTSILVLLIFSFLFYLVPPKDRDKFAPANHSTTETRPDGGKALYLLLDELGFKIGQWTDSYLALENEDCACVKYLFVNEPLYPPLPEEIEKILLWVKKGGVLIWGAGERDLLAKKLGVKQLHVNFGQVTLNKFPKHNIFQNVKKIKVEREFWLKPDSLSSDNKITPLISEEQKVLLMEVTHGKGVIYLHTLPLFFSNKTLPLDDNAVLAVNLIEYITKFNTKHHSAVWFDEYHNGFISERDIWDVMPLWLKLVLLQTVILALVLFIYHSKRFGSPFPLPQTPRRSIIEYISSTANLYRRAQARPGIFRLLYTGFKYKTCHFLGIPLDTPAHQIVSNLKSRKKIKEKEFESFLIKCDGYLQKRTLTEPELLTLAKELERWRKELITK